MPADPDDGRDPVCPACGLAPMYGVRLVAGASAARFARCPRGHVDAAGATADAASEAWRRAVLHAAGDAARRQA